jgi:hypothetical protein
MCISNKNNLQRIIAPIPSLPPLIHVTKKVHTCKCCKILDTQGCTNNVHKNGHKIWHVLHSLVESMSIGDLTDEECSNMSITIKNIIKIVPCIECRLHSLTWWNKNILNNDRLRTKELWMYEVWHHHDSVSKKNNYANPKRKTTQLSWSDYKSQVMINNITCKIH